MKINKIVRFALITALYAGFAAYILYAYFKPHRCSYETTIDKCVVPKTEENGEGYYYALETKEIITDDPFHLTDFSGWIVKQNGDYCIPVDFDLILEGKNQSYKVEVFPVKRTDIYYLDQTDPNSKSLNAGFLAHFPCDVLAKGKYKIGFLIKESSDYSVLWTEETFVYENDLEGV